MSKKTLTSEITKKNLIAWEEAAPIHARHNMTWLLEAVKAPDFTCLDATEMGVLTELDVVGKNVAQMCCNNGRELISVKNMGAARCVGFDGAQGFVDQARALAEAAGQDTEFVCCDAYDITAQYQGQFDLVTITIGVLGWMPDLNAFFAETAKLLKPGGAIFIYEHHPIVVMVEPGAADAPIEWELSYFRTDPYVDSSGLDYYGGEAYEATPNASFSHKMSDIIVAGVRAGMAVEQFEELPNHISHMWWNVEASGIGLPMSYILVLRGKGA